MSDIREDLKAFVDGELMPERVQEIQDALAADPALQLEVDFMERLSEEIRAVAWEPEPEGLEETLLRVQEGRIGRYGYVAEPRVPFGEQVELAASRSKEFFRMPPNFEVPEDSTEPPASPSEPVSAAPEPEVVREAKQAPGRGLAWWHPGSRVGRFAYAASLFLVLIAAASVVGPRLGSGGGAFAGDDATASAPAGVAPDVSAGAVLEERSVAPGVAVPGEVMDTEQIVPKRSAPPEPAAIQTPMAQRLVLKNGDLRVRVNDAAKSQADAMRLAEALGGFTEDSSFSGADSRLPVATVTVRVPSSRFDSAMEQLSALGNVLDRRVSASDVTTQVADLEARMKVLRAEEESYVAMLRAARRVGELLEIRERLSMVRQQIESLDAQRRVLRDQASLSTIRVSLEQRVTSAAGRVDERRGWAEEAWASAGEALGRVGRFLGEAAIWALVLVPVWVPPLVLFWWLGRRARR